MKPSPFFKSENSESIETVSSVIQVSQHLGFSTAKVVDEKISVFEGIQILSECGRICVVDDKKRILGIVKSSEMVFFLSEILLEYFPSMGELSLLEMQVIENSLFCVSPNLSCLQAFLSLSQKKIESVAIVDSQQMIRAQLSFSSLRVCPISKFK